LELDSNVNTFNQTFFELPEEVPEFLSLLVTTANNGLDEQMTLVFSS
jgi:hypothetical protein